MMPVMDGWEFRERQLQNERIADVPVICVTALHEPEKASRALGVPCLQKPLDFDALLRAVACTCDERTWPSRNLRPPRHSKDR
jgi:CheY-like chemotaxis protein